MHSNTTIGSCSKHPFFNFVNCPLCAAEGVHNNIYIAPPMAIDPKKKRVEVHILPELKDALVELAKADKRSLLNYIETILDKHVKEQKRKSLK